GKAGGSGSSRGHAPADRSADCRLGHQNDDARTRRLGGRARFCPYLKVECRPSPPPNGPQSIGSTFTIEAPWLLPTQNVTGVVELSTNTRRMLVVFGNRYSTNSPVLGFSRDTRSLSIEPVQASPFLSVTTS